MSNKVFKFKIKLTPECDIPDQIYCEAVELFASRIQKYLQERVNSNDPNVYDCLFPNGRSPDKLQIHGQFSPTVLNLPSLRYCKIHPVGGNAHIFSVCHEAPSQRKKKHADRTSINRQKV